MTKRAGLSIVVGVLAITAVVVVLSHIGSGTSDAERHDADGNVLLDFGSVVLRLRPGQTYSYTSPKKDGAGRFSQYLKYPQYFSPPPVTLTERDALVEVQLRAFGEELPQDWDASLNQTNWSSITKLPELNLTEYLRTSPNAASWGALTYVADFKERTPKGSLVVFQCTRDEKSGAPIDCKTSWQHELGPMVTYFQSGPLLPYWRQIRTDVRTFVDSIVVKKNDVTGE